MCIKKGDPCAFCERKLGSPLLAMEGGLQCGKCLKYICEDCYAPPGLCPDCLKRSQLEKVANALGWEIEQDYSYFLLKYKDGGGYFYDLETAIRNGTKNLRLLFTEPCVYVAIQEYLIVELVSELRLRKKGDGWVCNLSDSYYYPLTHRNSLMSIEGEGDTTQESLLDVMVQYLEGKRA